jgi:hypothetical protein
MLIPINNPVNGRIFFVEVNLFPQLAAIIISREFAGADSTGI